MQETIVLNRYQELRSKNKKYCSKGFTIIELMIAVAILAIVVVFGAPSFGDLIQRQTVNGETQKLVAAFKIARIEALSRARTIEVYWNATAANITPYVNAVVVPGNIMVVDPASLTPDTGAAPGVEVIHNATYIHPRLFIEDNETNDAIIFDVQGRPTVASLNLSAGDTELIIGVCKADGDSSDSQTVQVFPIGRIVTVGNDGGGEIDCT